MLLFPWGNFPSVGFLRRVAGDSQEKRDQTLCDSRHWEHRCQCRSMPDAREILPGRAAVKESLPEQDAADDPFPLVYLPT
eukprot:14129810-Alexandrium_andersonii.AAC.1